MPQLNHKNVLESDGEAETKTTLISRNITVMNHRTSVRLEPEMWTALREIANREQCSIHDICTLISIRKNPNTSLTAAIRVFLMLYFRAAATEEGHSRAGHGDFESMRQRARVSDDAHMSSARRKISRSAVSKGPHLMNFAQQEGAPSFNTSL